MLAFCHLCVILFPYLCWGGSRPAPPLGQIQVTASIQKSLKFLCCSGMGYSVIHKACVLIAMTRYSLDCKEDWEAQLTIRFTEWSWKRNQYRLNQEARCTDTAKLLQRALPQCSLLPCAFPTTPSSSPSFAIFHTSPPQIPFFFLCFFPHILIIQKRYKFFLWS